MNKNKYIIKNCPAGQIVTSAIDPDKAGVYCKMIHGPCQDCADCILKKVFKKSLECNHIDILALIDIGD